MPCDKDYANHDVFEYVEVLNEVSDICNKTASQHFVLGGDFNTDLTRDTPQTRAICSCVKKLTNVLCIDTECSNIHYTYCSNRNGCKSTIDHSTVTTNLRDSINKYESVFMNSDFLLMFHYALSCKQMCHIMKCLNVNVKGCILA